MDFMSKSKKISAILKQGDAERSKENKSVNYQVELQRNMIIDGIVIRLMKNQKEVNLSSVIEQTSR